MKTIKHTIRLKGFDLESGKISLSMLEKLSHQLISLSESTMLSFFEGNSNKTRGKNPEWLRKSLDFQLTGIKKGSSIIDIEAPELSETISGIPSYLFEDMNPSEINNNSALGFSMLAYEQVLKENYNSSLLDKNLLKQMTNFNSFLNSEDATIEISDSNRMNPIYIKKENIDKIKTIEIQTPRHIRTRLTGILDVIKHSKEQLELLIGNRRVRALLSDQIKLTDIINYFGKELSIIGNVYYKPSQEVKCIEIISFEPPDNNQTYFHSLPNPIQDKIDVKGLVKKQGFQGTNFNNLLGNWPGDEEIQEIIESCK